MDLITVKDNLFEKVNEIFEATNLPKLSIRSTGGGSDAAYTTQLGIPTLDSIGVESENIHSKNECAIISSLKEAAKRIAACAIIYKIKEKFKDEYFINRK